MKPLLIYRYQPKHPLLKQLIKFYWVLKSESPAALNHKLLPVSNIDFVFNFSSPLFYISGGIVEKIPKYSFSGIRNHYYLAHQTGMLNLLGISFYPAGLYPFLKTPLSEFTNHTVEIDAVIPNFNAIIEAKICSLGTNIQWIAKIEELLLNLIDYRLFPAEKTYHLLNSFYENIPNLGVKSFSDQYGISQRRLERLFNKYIGISPKSFKKLKRFQRTINQILNRNFSDFTSIAYENGYYDQAHFIKEFASFTGNTPSQFAVAKNSMKDLLEYC